MPRYLLDTNICIYIAKRKPPEVLARFESLAEGEVAMSLITFGELRYGANRSANAIKALETIEQLATAIPASWGQSCNTQPSSIRPIDRISGARITLALPAPPMSHGSWGQNAMLRSP